MLTSFSAARPMRSLGAFCFFLMLIVSWDSRAQQVIDQRELENIKVGEVVRLNGLLKKPAGTVCVLYPYQTSLHEKGSLGRQINTHLEAVNYSADEGHWAFVFVDGDNVSVQRFRRSERLDIRSGHESLPLGFRPLNCTTVAQAGVAKVQVSNRNYLVLGEIQ